MSESVFRELARALGRLPNGFPQTELEIELCDRCHVQAKLHRKPEEQIRHPPEDFSVWEQQRLQNRGLKEI